MVQESPGGWLDPAAPFLAETLLECWGGHVSSESKSFKHPCGRTWVLIAADDAWRTTTQPTGLLLLLQVERIPQGCGVFYPHPDHAAHVMVTQDFQQSLRNAWNVVLGQEHPTSDVRRCDYRWRLEVIDNSHTAQVLRQEVAAVEQQIGVLWHRRRSLLFFRRLSGRSGEIAMTAGLRSAVQQIPLNLRRAASGEFQAALPHAGDMVLRKVEAVPQKEIGIREADTELARAFNLQTIEEVVLAAGTIPSVTLQHPPLFVSHFEAAWSALSEHSQMTERYHSKILSRTSQWFIRNCFADRDHPRGNYVGNRLLRVTSPGSKELPAEQVEAFSTGRIADALAVSSDDQSCRLITILARSGAGKTAFLVHCEYEISASSGDCIPIRLERYHELFSQLGRAAYLDAAVTQVASLLMLDDRNSRQVVRDEVRSWLVRKAEHGEIVWLLDDMQPKPEDQECVRSLARAFPRCKLIQTIRLGHDQIAGQFVEGVDEAEWLMLVLQPYSKRHAREYLTSAGLDPSLQRLRVWQQKVAALGQSGELYRYLIGLTEKFRTLRLQGIRQLGEIEIELDQVYIALKAEPKNDYDREQEEELHAREVCESAGVSSVDVIDSERLQQLDAANTRSIYRPHRDAAKWSSVKETLNAADAFRQHRRMVVLGVPGSGKTTLGKWLALHMARGLAMQLMTGNPIPVDVPVTQVDPELGLKQSDEVIRLGPARIPIFLRIAHYARKLAEMKDQHRGSLALIEFLGRDEDSESLQDGFSQDARNHIFRTLIDSGEAVVVLDGLDELTDANRWEVVKEVRKFVETYAVGEEDDDLPPWECGGTQVIITSRYVGYGSIPVRAGCVHFGIQAMQRPAVERFIHTWSEAVNPKLERASIPGLVADELIAKIYHEAKPAVRELATNPLLITILATVYLTKRELPEQRAGLYDSVVENLLEIWLAREECERWGLKREELLAALEPLAAEMQQNANSNGLVDLDTIEEVITGPLAHMRGMKESDRRFWEVRDALLSTIPTQVGLLAEQSAGNYAFFHRTFQEFMAARHLLADHDTAAEEIVSRLDDPLWREPLLLALGFAMIDGSWRRKAREQLLIQVLAADGEQALIPRSALLVVAALPDLQDVPASVVEITTSRLLVSYAISLGQPQAAVLREQIEQAFTRFREGSQCELVDSCIVKSIDGQANASDLAGACATLLRQIDWFTTDVVVALLTARGRDQLSQGWPIHRALQTALAYRPAAIPWLRSAPKLQLSQIAPLIPLRRLLETHPELVAFVQRDTDWLWLLTALYGGLPHTDLLERHQRILEQRISLTQEIPIDRPLAEVEEAAVERLVEFSPVQFSPDDIVYDLTDSSMCRQIHDHLATQQPASELMAHFDRQWLSGSSPTACTEALVGLAALGKDVVPMLRSALQEPGRQIAARMAIDRFAYLGASLREPLLRSYQTILRTIPHRAPETHQSDLLEIAQVILLGNGSGPLKVSDRIPEYRFVQARSPLLRASVEAEYWSYRFAGTNPVNHQPSNPVGEILSCPADDLLRSWSLLYKSRNHNTTHRVPWLQPVLPPRADSAVEQYLALLDSITHVPKEFQFLAGIVLGRCQPIVDEYPDLLCETITLIRSHAASFREGFLSVPRELTISDRVLSELAADGAPEAVLAIIRPWNDLRFRNVDQLMQHAVANLTPDELLAIQDLLLKHTAPTFPHDSDPIWSSEDEYYARAENITDSYLRFRAEWRHFIYTLNSTWEQALRRRPAEGKTAEPKIEWPVPGHPDGTDDRLATLGVLVKLEKFQDPHHRIRACESILAAIPYSYRSIAKLVVNFSDQIEDHENRARTQFRLALYLREHEVQLIERGLQSLRMISAPERCVETIREVRTVWGAHRKVAAELDSIAEAISDGWLRDKALGRISRMVHVYRSQYAIGTLVWRMDGDPSETSSQEHRQRRPAGALPWALVYLSATAAEVEALDVTSTGVGEVTRFLTREQLDVKTIARTEVGVPLTAREASIMDRKIQVGSIAEMEHLWPQLERPTPDAQATVNRWMERDDLAGKWSALVQAEAGRLTADVVGKVIELLTTSTDRLQMRASLALHGRTAYVQNTNRRWSVRRVGVEAVEMVARHILDPNCKPAVRTSLTWIQHDLHCDAPEAIRDWLNQVSDERAELGSAEWILRNLESASHECVLLLIDGLSTNSPTRQRIILRTLGRIAHCTTILKDSTAWICEALSAVPLQIRANECVLGNGPATLLEIANKAVTVRGDDAGLARARMLLEAELLWLNDSDLLNDLSAQKKLQTIGGQYYIYLKSYWKNADDTAATIQDPAEVLRFLLTWLETEARYRGTIVIIPHLLTAIEAVAKLSPLAFARIAKPNIWEPFLTKCVLKEDHWTSRLAAIRLLGRLRCVTDQVVAALQSAMNDVSFVQDAAYDAACEFRRVNSDLLPELLKLLGDPSAAVAAATTRLLTGIARSECVPSDRRRILQGLQDAAIRPNLSRPVYLMRETGEKMEIKYIDSLDRILYGTIFEISGM